MPQRQEGIEHLPAIDWRQWIKKISRRLKRLTRPAAISVAARLWSLMISARGILWLVNAGEDGAGMTRPLCHGGRLRSAVDRGRHESRRISGISSNGCMAALAGLRLTGRRPPINYLTAEPA